MDVLHSVFCAGSAAVTTVTFIHPIDTVKTRLQISGTNGVRDYKSLGLVGTVKTIGSEEGAAAFYKGINAAWLRESSYTSLRLGLYSPLKKLLGAEGADASFLQKFTAGGLAGALGSVVGNPFDVLKTKMMASESGVSMVATARAISSKEGIMGFYRGMDANIMRAVVNNGTKMACYDQTKQALRKTGWLGKDGVPLQAASAGIAGFFMTCAVAPFDMVRTRLMSQPVDQPKVYKNFADCLVKMVKADGPLALWAGFVPMWSRVAPTSILQLIFYEQISRLTGGKTL